MSREATAGLRSIFGRIALSQTALRSQRNKDWKNNSLFASPSICCSTADTVAAMTAALPYMETEIQELAEHTAEKLKQLTEEKFAGLVFLPAEDTE